VHAVWRQRRWVHVTRVSDMWAERWGPWHCKVMARRNGIVATAGMYVPAVSLRIDRSSGKNRCSRAWVDVYVQRHRGTG
jgi:hypothetical protein